MEVSMVKKLDCHLYMLLIDFTLFVESTFLMIGNTVPQYIKVIYAITET